MTLRPALLPRLAACLLPALALCLPWTARADRIDDYVRKRM